MDDIEYLQNMIQDLTMRNNYLREELELVGVLLHDEGSDYLKSYIEACKFLKVSGADEKAPMFLQEMCINLQDMSVGGKGV